MNVTHIMTRQKVDVCFCAFHELTVMKANEVTIQAGFRPNATENLLHCWRIDTALVLSAAAAAASCCWQ